MFVGDQNCTIWNDHELSVEKFENISNEGAELFLHSFIGVGDFAEKKFKHVFEDLNGETKQYRENRKCFTSHSGKGVAHNSFGFDSWVVNTFLPNHCDRIGMVKTGK